MDSTSPRAARLQQLHRRWFSEPLGIDFPDIGLPAPVTCDELVRGPMVASSFSAITDAPEAAGMTPQAAAQADRQANAGRYGVEDPRGLMAELSAELAKLPAGLVKADVIKKAFVVLDEVHTDSAALAASVTGDLQPVHQAEAAALAKAKAVVSDAAAELGISLPLNRGVRPGGKA
jgi:hypothetical protein